MSEVAGASRISITGNSGSGKSTVAVQLGRILGHPVIHLDQVYWSAPNRPVPEDRFWRDLGEVLAKPSWIAEGFHIPSSEARFDASDVVIFLDLPAHVCVFRLLRAWDQPRPGTPSGASRMGVRELVGFLRWVWIFPSDRRPGTLWHLEKRPEKALVLRSSREVRRFLSDLRREVQMACQH